MSKRSFAKMNCAVAQTLERVGDWWTMLILRNAFCGMTRFDELRAHLGIATNVLSSRLRKLVAYGIMTRAPAADDGRAADYRLTESGLALYPVLIAMTEWGERWAPNPKGARIELFERSTGKRIAGVAVRSSSGRALRPRDVRAVAGPGADRKIRALLTARR